MPVITRLGDGRYFMVYENDHRFPAVPTNLSVSFKYSTDGLEWGDIRDPGGFIKTNEGAYLWSAPYVEYIPGVGAKGRLIVRSTMQFPLAAPGVGSYIYYNDNNGEGDWGIIENPTPYYHTAEHNGYSSGMFLSADKKILHLVCTVDNPESNKNYSKIVYSRLEKGTGW